MNFGHVSPSFMIIGVQKGGTSSLYFYLQQHPDLIASSPKELHYFDTLNVTPSQNYKKLFPKKYFTYHRSFEATPRYIYYPGTAKKIHEFDPKMKFIVLLRDPVKRAFSAWNMYRQMKEDKLLLEIFANKTVISPREQLYPFLYKDQPVFPSFETCVEKELSLDFDSSIIEPSFIKRGYYKEQIETYFDYFDLASFLFLEFEDFKNDILGCLNTIAGFLSISNFDRLTLNLEPKNKRKYNENMDEVLYLKLLKHFQSKNQGLEELIGLKLKWMHIPI